MSEKQKREQLKDSSLKEQEVKTSATHETPVDQPQIHEKEQKDKDLENLHRTASEKARLIANALISKNNLNFYPSEKQQYEKELTNNLESILKQAYESGKSDSVSDDIDKFIDDAITNNERDKKWQERIAKSDVEDKRRRNLEAELKSLEGKSELSEQENLKLQEFNKLQKEHLENTEHCKKRWEKLSAEDQQSIKDNIKKSIKDIQYNKDLSLDQKGAAIANLRKNIATEWGPELALYLHSNALAGLKKSESISTADVEKIKEEEEDSPIRAKGLKRLFNGLKGAKNKAKYAYVVSNGSPSKFVSEVLKRDSKKFEGMDEKRKKIIRNLAVVAIGVAAGTAVARATGVVDFDNMSMPDWMPFTGDDVIDSSPDINPDSPTDPSEAYRNGEGDGSGEVPGNNEWSGEYVPENPEQPWSGHNYFDHGYSLENSPFTTEGKNGAFDYGPPLDLGENFNENLLERIDSEPAMHIDYIKEYNLEGSDLSDSEIRDRLMTDREYFESTLEDIRHRLEYSESEIITLDSGTYGSTYHYENGGIVESAYDSSVDSEGATAVRKRFVDENGVEYITTIKSECGGQLIVEHTPYTAHVAPIQYVETPGGEYTPPVYHSEQINNPIGGGEPPVPGITELPPEDIQVPAPEPGPTPDLPPEEPTVELPPVEEPPVEQPPIEEPPVEEPPVEEPPVEQPPVFEPEPKSSNPDDYVVPDGTPPAVVEGPATPPAQTETGQDIFDEEINDIYAPDTTVGTETDTRTDVIDGGASQEEIADLDLNTDHDSAVDQAVGGNKAPTPSNPGQEVQL